MFARECLKKRRPLRLSENQSEKACADTLIGKTGEKGSETTRKSNWPRRVWVRSKKYEELRSRN
jgi:hypothetical protein